MPFKATWTHETPAAQVWRRHQIAMLRQRHMQVGLHFQLDIDALLDRGALSIGLGAAPSAASEADRIRRATVEAVDYCARLPTRRIGAFAATW